MRKFDDDLYSVRDGDLKLVTKKRNSVKELYNLQDDLGEETIWQRRSHRRLKGWIHFVKTDAQLINPIFLGLIHTERWQKRLKKTIKKGVKIHSLFWIIVDSLLLDFKTFRVLY